MSNILDAKLDALASTLDGIHERATVEQARREITRLTAELDKATNETAALRDVKSERLRQQSAEGWTPDHDDTHNEGQMAKAAGCYALFSASSDEYRRDVAKHYRYGAPDLIRIEWPWDWSWWKPKDRRRDLVRAAALLLAEIERLDRMPLPLAPEVGS